MHRTFKVIDKTQAGGAQTVGLAGYERAGRHQIQVDVSETPTAGTMTIEIKTPGASDYVEIGEIDLVNGPLAAVFDGHVDAIRLTPVLFDADKTYTAHIFCLQV